MRAVSAFSGIAVPFNRLMSAGAAGRGHTARRKRQQHDLR